MRHMMIETVQEVRPLLARGQDFALVEESSVHPGELAFIHPEPERFVHAHKDYLSSFCQLNDLFMLRHFLAKLDAEGVTACFMPSAVPVIDNFDRWSAPLEVDGLVLPKGLHPFQQFGMNRSFEISNTARTKVSGFFYNYGTGTGKSVMAAGGAQELVVNRGAADVVLAFTLRKNKINLARQIEGITDLKAEVIDGAKARRVRRYEAAASGESGVQVLVLNYEKANFDFPELVALLANRRALFVLDEVQHVLHGENAAANKARKGLDDLVKVPRRSLVWPMSASVVKASPLRYHDVYQLMYPTRNPLGSRKDFVDRYCRSVTRFEIRPQVVLKTYDWDEAELAEVRHRVASKTQAVRKTDPGVREYFKGIESVVVPVQLSTEERRLYEAIQEDYELRAEEDPDLPFTQHYNCLRYICNTPRSLLFSESPVAADITERHPELVDVASTKFEMVCDQIQDIRDQGDQVVVFTHWTKLSLFLLAKEFDQRGIRYVQHYGTGMSDREAQLAQDRFRADPETTVFLSSDAGAHALNFTNARYVIHVECPYDYDTYIQRRDRIDRADSYLDGLTSYVYVTDDSVEERVWKIMNLRRALAAAVQGTEESLSRLSAEDMALLNMSETQAMRTLVRRG